MSGDYGLLLLSPCLGSLKNVISKSGGKRVRGIDKLLWLNVITSLLAMLVFGVSGVSFSVMKGGKFIALALSYGLFSMLSQVFYILAVDKGPVAVCSMIYSSGFLIPTLFSAIYYREPVSPLRVAGIVLLLGSIYLIVRTKPQAGEKKTSNAYLLCALLAMLSSGIIGALQKLFTHNYPHTQLNSYLFLSFSCMLGITLLTQLILLFFKKSEPTTGERATKRELAAVGLLFTALGLCNVFANKLNLYLSGTFSGMVCFPVVNGGCVALTAISSRLLFKEKLHAWKIVGLCVGVGSIILIAL